MLSAAMQLPSEFLSFVPSGEKQIAVVNVAGTFLTDRGMPGAAFNNRLTIDAPSIETTKQAQPIFYSYSVYVTPGLYQVRVGARDEKSGRAGSAHAWIEIPNLASGQLALSSLMIGLRTQPTISNTSANTQAPGPVELSVTHNFSADGFLRFMVFAYNAALAPADSKPDAAIQVQVVRDDQPVITTLMRKVSTEGISDLGRIPYAAEIPLRGLPAGRYILKVTVVDRVVKRSASQQIRFEIE